MRKLVLIALIAPAVLALSACGPKGNEPNVELIQDMMVQNAVKAQRAEPFFADEIGMRMPPENTKPIGFTPYKHDLASANGLKNPYGQEDAVLLTGQKYYDTNCAVCHGYQGQGDGPIAKKYPLPIPALVTAKAKGYSDGHIYHVITVGQGTMGPYASHVPQQFRWQVVSYIRKLQKEVDLRSNKDN